MHTDTVIIIVDALIFNAALFTFLARFIRKNARREEPVSFG
jgi:hypothetical protein